MKIAAAILVLLLAGSNAFGQKIKDPGMRTNEGRPRHNAAYKSAHGDAVAAARTRNSTTASQLAQIEHQGDRPRSAHTSAHANAALPNGNVAGQEKNKPIHFSHKAPRAAGKTH